MNRAAKRSGMVSKEGKTGPVREVIAEPVPESVPEGENWACPEVRELRTIRS